jgi:flagellar biosynthesis/type III secretory pathway M-ring protein FliF/YscJ
LAVLSKSWRDKISKLITKEHKLLLVLAVSVLIAIFVVKWANEDSPIYRPLIQDMRLVDSVQISDVLDQERIYYYADVKNHMLYVNQEQTELARVSLAKIGIVIEYPEITRHTDLNKAYDEFIKQKEVDEETGKIWQRPWFFKLVKLVMGALVVIILILAVVRPALASIIYDEDEK